MEKNKIIIFILVAIAFACIFIAIFAVALNAIPTSFSQSNFKPSASAPTSTATLSPTVAPTPTPIKPNISISGTYQKLTEFDAYTFSSGSSSGNPVDSSYPLATAEPGNIFLEANITISNFGYNSFSPAEYYFSVTANKIQYNTDTIGMLITNNWNNNVQSIQNGGIFSGTLVFQIPADSTGISFGYTDPFDQYNIMWNIKG